MNLIITANNALPLCFRTSRFDKNVTTFEYIPGSTLLGGLAAAHHRLNRSKSEFAQFFTANQIQYGNLYPANFKTLTGNDFPVKPIPFTAVSCKRFDGFQYIDDENDEEERHGVSDDLIPWALFCINGMSDPDILYQRKDCKICGSPATPFRGFCRRGEEIQQIASSKIHKRVITRAGISRKRGSVIDQILYNRQVLEENQSFWGNIYLSDETLLDAFEEFLEEATDNELVYLGNNKSRGMGKMSLDYHRIDVNRASEENKFDLLGSRITAFNEKLRSKADEYSISVPNDVWYIPVTLESDAIIKDELFRLPPSLTSDYFDSEWDLKGIKTVYQCINTIKIMSWNSVFCLPDSDDMAFKMGSVFLLSYKGSLNDDFLKKTHEMQQNGLGERRHEGFGNITVADSFHTEVIEL